MVQYTPCLIWYLLSTSTYPHHWKISRIRPIPKSRYSFLSALAKLFESILHGTLSKQVKPLCLCNTQHGFRVKRSEKTNLTLVDSDTISEHLDMGILIDVLYYDFRKAFNRVGNDVFLHKLDAIGFNPHLLNIFASYLRDQPQYATTSMATSYQIRTILVLVTAKIQSWGLSYLE